MSPKVLVADADSDLCDLYRRFFAKNGWQVQLSDGGVDCLAQLRRSPPGLLILDWQLLWGGADGVLDVMREDGRLSSIPVVLTFTNAPRETLSELTAAPVVQALEKPFSLTALLQGFGRIAAPAG